MLPKAAQDLKGQGLEAGFCLRCHTPVATVDKEISSYSSVSYPPKISPVAMEGVTCDFCHTISGNENFGHEISRGVYLYPRKGDTAIKYGTHSDANTTNHITTESKFLKSAELCGICHNFPHPSSGPPMQDTYEEWKSGPYPGLGIQCQDCHMPQYTGSSSLGAPERKDLHAHVFPGGRSDLVKKVAKVTLLPPDLKGAKGKLDLKALVTNIGSGHKMPTGLPGLREMWLQVVVRTGDGAELFTNRTPIGVEPRDADGKPTMPWNAKTFGPDTRIGPQEFRQTQWQVPLPQTMPDQLEVSASVFYRSISELAARAAGTNASPAIEIATDRLRILKDGRVEKIPVR